MPSSLRIALGCIPAALLAQCAAASAQAHAQPPVQDARISAISDISPEWMFWQGISQSRNDRFVAAITGNGALMRFDRRTRNWTPVPGIQIEGGSSWSPDGRFLAYTAEDPQARGDYLWLVPMDTATGLPNGTARRVSTSTASYPAFSPDGRRVAFISRDSTSVRIVSVPFNGGDEQVHYTGPGYRRYLAWSPDGQFLLAGEGTARPPDQLRVNTRTGRAETVPVEGNVLLGVSPDGRFVADLNQLNMQVTIATFPENRIVQRIRLPRNTIPLRWTWTEPRSLLALESINPSRLLEVSLADGRIREFTPADSASSSALATSPDGRTIAWVSRGPVTARLMLSGTDGRNRRTLVETGDIDAVHWSPTGTHIAFRANGDTGTISVVDVTSGQLRVVARATGTSLLGTAVGWRSDGQAVRYIWRPRGQFDGAREAREVTLAGASRVLGQAPIPQGDVLTNRATEPHFVNDTLLLLRNGQGVGAVHLRTGVVRTLYTGRMRPRNEFGVSPDGEWIAFAAWNGDKAVPTLVSLRTGEQRQVPYGLGAELGPVFFHPDGRHLVAPACLRCSTEKFDIVMLPMNGDPARVLTSTLTGYVDFWSPSVAPDGRRIIFTGDLSWSSRFVTLTLPTPP